MAVSLTGVRGHPVYNRVTFNMATWSQGYSLEHVYSAVNIGTRVLPGTCIQCG